MHRNILLIRADVGQVCPQPEVTSMAEVASCENPPEARSSVSVQMKRTTLSHVSSDKIFGYRRPHDAEGAGIGKLLVTPDLCHWRGFEMFFSLYAHMIAASHALPLGDRRELLAYLFLKCLQ